MAYLRRVISDTVILVGAGGVVNVLNYVYVIVALHLLAKVEFGAFSTLVNCLTISTVITNILQLEVTKRVAIERNPSKYFLRLTRITVIGCVVLVVPVLAGASTIARALHVGPYDIVALYFALVALTLSCLGNGWFGGKQRITAQALWTFLGTLFKVGSGAGLLALGYGVAGGIGAFGLGLLVVFMAAFLSVERSSEIVASASVAAPSRWRNLLLLITAYVLLIWPFSVDQVLVQSIFLPLSGDYGAVAMLGKLVFFASAPVFTVMYSHLCGAQGNVRMQRQVFIVGVLATIVLSLMVIVGLLLFREQLVTRVLPYNYVNTAPLVPLFSCGLLLYGLTYAAAIYCIAAGTIRGLICALLPAVLLQWWLFYGADGTLDGLVWRQAVVYGVQFLCVVVMLIVGSMLPLGQRTFIIGNER